MPDDPNRTLSRAVAAVVPGVPVVTLERPPFLLVATGRRVTPDERDAMYALAREAYGDPETRLVISPFDQPDALLEIARLVAASARAEGRADAGMEEFAETIRARARSTLN